MRGRRMKKLFDAINLPAQPYGATIKDLAKRLETTERQAYRTIETLQDDFHFVITKDQALLGSDVRYYLKEKDQVTSFTKMKVADLNLSLTEVIALYFLKGHARLYQGTEIETEISRAFAKLDTFVPDGFEKRLEKVKTLFSPSSQFTKSFPDVTQPTCSSCRKPAGFFRSHFNFVVEAFHGAQGKSPIETIAQAGSTITPRPVSRHCDVAGGGLNKLQFAPLTY